jgi:hypothetical protein
MHGVNAISGSPVATTSGQSHLESAGCNNFRQIPRRIGGLQQFPPEASCHRRVATISAMSQIATAGHNNFRQILNVNARLQQLPANGIKDSPVTTISAR